MCGGVETRGHKGSHTAELDKLYKKFFFEDWAFSLVL